MTSLFCCFWANLTTLQNLNPMIASGINKIAKESEKTSTDTITIISRSGMAIKLGKFEVIRIDETSM